MILTPEPIKKVAFLLNWFVGFIYSCPRVQRNTSVYAWQWSVGWPLFVLFGLDAQEPDHRMKWEVFERKRATNTWNRNNLSRSQHNLSLIVDCCCSSCFVSAQSLSNRHNSGVLRVSHTYASCYTFGVTRCVARSQMNASKFCESGHVPSVRQMTLHTTWIAFCCSLLTAHTWTYIKIHNITPFLGSIV